MSVKDFIQTWTGSELKEMDKEDRMYSVYDNMAEITEFYVTKGHNRKHIETVNKLYKVLSNEKFISTIEKMTKKKSDYYLIPEIAILFSEFVDRRGKELGEENVERYATVVDKLLKPRVKELRAKIDLPKSVITETLVVLPDKEIVNEKFIGIYVNKALRKLYVLSNLLEKEELEDMAIGDLKRLFKSVFGKENFNVVLRTIALERRDLCSNFNEKQLIMWSKMTELLLQELNNMKKKSLKNFMFDLIEWRENAQKKNADYHRRVDFTKLQDDEEMEKINKIVCSIIEEDENCKRFLQ